MHTVFVANRAEIASRVLRTARALGYGTVAVCSESDRDLPYAHEADRTVVFEGPSEAGATYLDAKRLVEAALQSGADAVHPGYGFLSENAAFAQQVLDAGLVWVGPPPAAIAAMGDKARARNVAEAHDVPVVPGYTGDQAPASLQAAAAEIGYPVLLKAVAGGGGRGMRRVDRASDFAEALASAKREAKGAFGDDAMIIERYVLRPRHLEVQILADAHGNVVHLGERECSVQRRHQKVIEEAPSPMVDAALRERLGSAAVAVAKAVGYVGAGTVEFVATTEGAFYFLEMNTRLQVEHPVTELVTGFDLVALQLAVADGEVLPFGQDDVKICGHAIEARIVAEDPMRAFLPGTGTLLRFDLPAQEGVRVDAGFAAGNTVSPYYDAMLAKVIGFGPDRRIATRRLARAVGQAWIPGVVTNLPLLREVFAHPLWHDADLDTAFFDRARLPTAPPLNLVKGALAATALGHVERGAARVAPAGWRLYGRAEQHERYRCGTAEVAVAWTPTNEGFQARVTIDEDETTVTVGVGARDGDRLRLTVDGVAQHWRILRVPASPTHTTLDDGDLVYVHLGEGEAFVELVPRFPAPATAAATPGACVAPTPGKVTAVHVGVGDDVMGGQRLLTIEAMKMEHPVVAPNDGVVGSVQVAVGDTVTEGQLLVQVD